MTLARELIEAAERLDPRVLLSAFQIRIISDALSRHHFAARFLVYGCGYDSPYWHFLNRHGRTLFVEENAEWIEGLRRKVPGIEIEHYAFSETTVADTAELIDQQKLESIPRPFWATIPWDIVLIDGPTGHDPKSPGRSLPIHWAASSQPAETDIFIDDYERPLEKKYCDRLLAGGRMTAVLPGKTTMFWRVGMFGETRPRIGTE